MSQTDPRELRRYLLGDLSENDRDRQEYVLLTDEGSLQAVREAKDDLIETYLDGALTADERARFEGQFLSSPEHRRALAAARVIRERLSGGAGRAVPSFDTRRWMQLAAAVIVAALAAFGVMRRPGGEGPDLADGTSVTLALSPDGHMSGGADSPEAVVTARTTVLRLELVTDDVDLGRCRAEISIPEHGVVWSGSGIEPRREDGAAVLSLHVPMAQLPPAAAYRVSVFEERSGDRHGTYSFQLRRP